MTSHLTNPKQIADAGERIYRDKFQKEFEGKYNGEFVAIDVTTETAHLGKTVDEAIAAARASNSKGIFHLIRVGFPSAYQVSYSYRNASSDWIFG